MPMKKVGTGVGVRFSPPEADLMRKATQGKGICNFHDMPVSPPVGLRELVSPKP